MAGDTAAAAQAAPVFLDREATISRLAEWVAKARDAGADLVVFGESFVPAFPLWNMLYAPVEQLDQPLPKCVYGSGRNIIGRPDAHKSDHRRPRLLRARRERPRRRAAEERYQLAPFV